MTKIDRINKAIDCCGDIKGRKCQFCPYRKAEDCHIAILKEMKDLMIALELRD